MKFSGISWIYSSARLNLSQTWIAELTRLGRRPRSVIQKREFVVSIRYHVDIKDAEKKHCAFARNGSINAMSDIVDSPDKYFRQFIPRRDSLLIALEEEARHQDIPIVGPVVGELLFVLAQISKARRILELGTATGYSAIYLARACTIFDGKVITHSPEHDGVCLALRQLDNCAHECQS